MDRPIIWIRVQKEISPKEIKSLGDNLQKALENKYTIIIVPEPFDIMTVEQAQDIIRMLVDKSLEL